LTDLLGPCARYEADIVALVERVIFARPGPRRPCRAAGHLPTCGRCPAHRRRPPL